MKIRERLAKLIDVKSIMTLTLTVAFVLLVAQGQIAGEQFMSVFTMVVGCYFGVQIAKKDNK